MRKGLAVVAGLVASLASLGPPANAGPQSFASAVPPANPSTDQAINNDAEPGVTVAPDGTLWATAFSLSNPPNGQDIWRSDDHGRRWQWVAAPFNLPSNHPLLGGDDADIAVATERNASGHFNIYVAGLWVTLAKSGVLVGDISLAVSTDGGATWVVDPLAGEVPADDRPWVAADGACRVDLVYHAGPTVSTIVNTYDLCNPVATAAGLTLAPLLSSRAPSLVVPAVTGQRATYVLAGFGKAVIDTSPESPYRHRLYIPQMDCPGLTILQEVQRAQAARSDCPAGHDAEVFVAVSPDGGVNWNEIPVAASDNNSVPIWPGTIATDARGRVYLAWHDTSNAWIQESGDGGTTWSAPQQLNSGLGAAVYPTVTASGSGDVDVAWYGADRSGHANDEAIMGAPGAPGAAVWSLWAARLTDGGGLDRFVADPVVHRGDLCTLGDACTVPESRDLFDDFGATTDPASGLTTLVYTSDQPGNSTSTDSVRTVTFPAVPGQS